MGIIVRDTETGRIVYYLKGADHVIRNRVLQNYQGFLKDNCDDLSREGYRTLVYAYKVLTEEEYKNFRNNYALAGNNLDTRE